MTDEEVTKINGLYTQIDNLNTENRSLREQVTSLKLVVEKSPGGDCDLGSVEKKLNSVEFKLDRLLNKQGNTK
jgi:SMC interacting uncharacterized protein involved in chromosome segregation